MQKFARSIYDKLPSQEQAKLVSPHENKFESFVSAQFALEAIEGVQMVKFKKGGS